MRPGLRAQHRPPRAADRGAEQRPRVRRQQRGADTQQPARAAMSRPGPWSVLGMGAVASIGTGVAEFFDALCAGKQGLAPLRGFDPGHYRSAAAYEIDDRPGPGRDVAGRATSFLLAAVAEALADAGLGDDLGGEIPVLVGTGLRELRSAEL